MPKRNLNSGEEEKLELEGPQNDPQGEQASLWWRIPLWLRIGGGIVILVFVVAGGYEVAYAGKVYPGVSADGVYVGGLSRSAASVSLNNQVSIYKNDTLAVTDSGSNVNIPLSSINLNYNVGRATDLAYSYGRQGSLWNQLHQQLRALLGRPTSYAVYSYSDSQLTPFFLNVDNSVTTPVEDAGLSFDGSLAQVTPSQAGARLDLGVLTEMVNERLSTTSSDAVVAPVYHLSAQLGTGPLQAAIGQITNLVSAPITLNYDGTSKVIDQSTLISWMQAQGNTASPFLQSLNLNDIYPALPTADLGLSRDAVSAYVAGLAKGTDKSAQNATLAMENNQLTVTQPSINGVALNQPQAVDDIIAALSKTGTSRVVNLNIQTTDAAVSETNLPNLGIDGLVSEGETYFPGSPAGRLTNVRAGAARFNNVLIAPGEVFSIGAQLGEVDASTGYVPELVIDGNHEDFQYGGGLCQVTTTAFRAALAAGLPIDEREAHSFAISYYQWPYGAPGVDATIYYPEVDLKFTNTTGHYILIQTIMKGDDLKFDFYGTKTQTGTIRGPYFISGSNNAALASHTVFYNDVKDLSGNLIRTDTFNSYYQPSTDFPIVGTP
jgi:vancomycin resistance protein YoaR